MEAIKSLITQMVSSIVDDTDSVLVSHSETEKGQLFEIEVAGNDVGKVIGKQGRIASAIRTVAKASGAKHGVRVMVNVLNKPREL
jgi:predicted RNA-binding protein YlqC (UPF0109 family)